MSIPKIIHYCWFGRGEKPELAVLELPDADDDAPTPENYDELRERMGYLGYGVVGVWFAHAILDWATRSAIFYARYRSGKWERMAIRS